MKFAYADPPYIGMAKRHYGPGAREVNHRLLLAHLTEYDGWALSLSSTSLEEVMHLCREVVGPNKVRVGAWVKPFHVYKKGVRPAYAWEPVVFAGGRNANHPPPPKGGRATTPKDFVSANITLRRGLVGAKPEAFSRWVFDILGMRHDDEFHDLFPGSGAVGDAWRAWRAQTVMQWA